MRRVIEIAALPFVVGAIYTWILKQAVKDTVRVVGRRFWPGPPIDHP